MFSELTEEYVEEELAKDLDAIEHINFSENINRDIEEYIHPAQHRSWMFSIGKMFTKKRKKIIMSKGNLFTLLAASVKYLMATC